ncbi:hypothetical protein [Oceanibacterium hippocampi]|uniref:Integrase n=1 Tax=Oceanibacterium hippocampi TaxID=745714 RepID=A0A1Y5T888_9PROT|nr:hypothetical protein [Oceanibacterium hippocampi]SLN55999.1 hypothetical protein OCH7691_02414 [Oceanibacterium hippocampi]
MPKNLPGLILKLLIASLIVGLAMSWFDVTPQAVFQDLGGAISRLFNAAVNGVRWAVPYILIGAVVVLPIWGGAYLLSWFRRRG